MMVGNTIWTDFCDKMSKDKLRDCDFTNEMQKFLSPLLCGTAAQLRRNKFLASFFEVYERDKKVSILVHCPDDDYRFDFIQIDKEWKLAFLECITLPVSDIQTLPYRDFAELPDKETAIRREKEISRIIFMYNKFKELLGREDAVKLFRDGEGEAVCARSWVPFYSDVLSYIAYAAWIENRINGEKVVIERFDEEMCRMRFCQHIWRKMYATTGHLRNMIDFSEYMYLFEEIWRDRACSSGWTLQFEYLEEDTLLTFYKEY